MHLMDLIHRYPTPLPWAEGDNIPWNDPGFSQRMLREHLSQEHDAASRRFTVIDTHVGWIHHELLSGQPTRILDLGCGPGFYTSRLARLGHLCTGIDFSPASIDYAREQASREGLPCTYLLEDVRAADFERGEGFGLVMFIFGEFNVFKPEQAEKIIMKAHRALLPGGALLLEPHPFAAVRELGREARRWRAEARGLFSDRPALYLEESFWNEQHRAATHRYWIVEAESGQVTRYASSYQAYTNVEYQSLLERCGFSQIQFYPSLAGHPGDPETDLIAITARK